MVSTSLLSELNVVGDCRKYGLPLWQCPHFLFLVMGGIIIGAIIVTYAVGTRYIEDPLSVAFLTLMLAMVLLSIAFTITNSFERLAEANRAKSEFVSIASHQLRSPLSNIKWSLEILMTKATDEGDAREYFQIIKENSERMQELVNDLLITSRIQEGTLILQKQEFSFKEFLKNIVGEFEPWIKASNIRLEIAGQEPIPRIFADPGVLRQVVANLLDNAIRYSKKIDSKTEEKGQNNHIWIRYKVQNNNLYFEIEDRGVGIPIEDQKYIFQKFFRASNISKYETTGSGLGLYIAKSMVEKSGGKIGFQSFPNKGSTFWFTIPIKK